MSRESMFAYAMDTYGLTVDTRVTCCCSTHPLPVRDNLPLIHRLRANHFQVMMYTDMDDELKFVVTL